MLAALGGLVSVWLVNSAAHRVPVLVVVRSIAAGTTITDADLAQTDVSVDSDVHTLPAQEASQVVGRVAAADLAPGQLLDPASVTDAGPPAPGQVLVVLSLPAARMPASGLHCWRSAPGGRHPTHGRRSADHATGDNPGEGRQSRGAGPERRDDGRCHRGGW